MHLRFREAIICNGQILFLRMSNELLKHQLKKYVGAVQKLRDGPQAYETLAKLEGAKESENCKYNDEINKI